MREDSGHFARMETSLIQAQVQLLRTLRSDGASWHEPAWAARKAFAFARARSAMRRLAEPDPEVMALVDALAATGEGDDDAPSWTDRDDRELALYELVLTDAEWARLAPRAEPAPASTLVLLEKGDVDVALKNEGVIAYLHEATDHAMLKYAFRSNAVRVMSALLVASIGFFILGSLRFGQVEFDVSKDIESRRGEMVQQLERQRAAYQELGVKARADSDAALAAVGQVSTRLDAAQQRVKALEGDADQILANFTLDLRRSTGAKVGEEMDKLYKNLEDKGADAKRQLDRWTEDQQKTISTAASRRADELSREARPEFPKKLEFLEGQVDGATKSYRDLQASLNKLEGQQIVLAKAMAQVVTPPRLMIARLAGYISEALWTIYGGAAIIVVLLVASVVLLRRAIKARR